MLPQYVLRHDSGRLVLAQMAKSVSSPYEASVWDRSLCIRLHYCCGSACAWLNWNSNFGLLSRSDVLGELDGGEAYL